MPAARPTCVGRNSGVSVAQASLAFRTWPAGAAAALPEATALAAAGLALADPGAAAVLGLAAAAALAGAETGAAEGAAELPQAASRIDSRGRRRSARMLGIVPESPLRGSWGLTFQLGTDEV